MPPSLPLLLLLLGTQGVAVKKVPFVFSLIFCFLLIGLGIHQQAVGVCVSACTQPQGAPTHASLR